MWFFRSIDLLPRPRLTGITPTLAMLAVWALFEGTAPRLFGRPVSPLWLALASSFALAYAARLPGLLTRDKLSPTGRRAVIAIATGLALVIAAGGLVTDPRILQIGWILGWALYTGLFVLLLISSGPRELAAWPYRWATNHPFARDAMWLMALRLATLVLAASLVAIHGTLGEWVITVTLGRLALFYLFEWVTILFALTWRDGDS